jgi:hypothetical protein
MRGEVNMRWAGVARLVLKQLTDPSMRRFAALSLASCSDKSGLWNYVRQKQPRGK